MSKARLPERLETNGHYLMLPGARDIIGCIDGDCGDDAPRGEPQCPWVMQERVAAEIVRRWNAHERLVEALRDSIEAIEGLAGQQAMPDYFYQPTLAAARAALAEIEG